MIINASVKTQKPESGDLSQVFLRSSAHASTLAAVNRGKQPQRTAGEGAEDVDPSNDAIDCPIYPAYLLIGGEIFVI